MRTRLATRPCIRYPNSGDFHCKAPQEAGRGLVRSNDSDGSKRRLLHQTPMTRRVQIKILKPLIYVLCAAITLVHGTAGATITGKVELPKTTRAPVMAKRYEIVSQGGAL